MNRTAKDGENMKYLFNSRGRHIANFVNNHLHTPSGKNIGHFLDREQIFVDMHGRYLGELICEDRLMRRHDSPHKSVSFGMLGNYGNAGNYGNPGNHGSIGIVSGFEDVPEDELA